MSSSNVDPDSLADALFPLPFRVLALVGVGIMGWATNLHGLHAYNIDVVSAMDLRTEAYPPNSPRTRRWNSYRHRTSPPHATIYALSAVYVIWLFVTWLIYASAMHGVPETADAFKYVVSVAILVIIAALICPFDILFKRDRDQFLSALSRCVFPAKSSPVLFADVVFADIFTSFAKVLGDCWLSLWMLLPGNSLLHRSHGPDWTWWVLPSVMSLPYLVRFRQCLIEYFLPPNESSRPLFNALKYATSFPVIYLSAAQRTVLLGFVQEKGKRVFDDTWHGEDRLFRLWLLSAIINSLYSFWWDTTYDFGLNLLKLKDRDSSQVSPRRPLILPHVNSDLPLLTRGNSHDVSEGIVRGHRKPRYQHLRPILLYPVLVYPMLVFVNFILRMTWSIKLSSHLHLNSDGSYNIFFVEVAEIVRRWLWVFVRVEWEVIRKAQEGSSKIGPEHSPESPSDVTD
ncbi:hypothetical protein APHAL10511_003680 [Amanita phalloides]|nr:hypothetical protein APHAL10511_003680 [Amanita phalloides]